MRIAFERPDRGQLRLVKKMVYILAKSFLESYQELQSVFYQMILKFFCKAKKANKLVAIALLSLGANCYYYTSDSL